jgi:ABC-2 type transport system permease protein
VVADVRPKRLLAVIRKEIIQIRRDGWSLGMAFAIPMLLLLLFGSVLTLDVDNLDTVVYDQDRTQKSRELIERFEASRYFRVRAYAGGWREVERALDSGRAQVGLVIPRNFARDLERGAVTPVQAVVDASDSNTATIALAYIDTIAARYSTQVAVQVAGGADPAAAVDGRLRVWYNPDLESKFFVVPGLVAVIMTVIGGLLSSLTVAREWERGTMEQLIATPVRVPELMLGKLVPYVGIGLLDVLLAVAGGTLVFGVPLRGSFWLLLGFSLLFLLGAVGLGVLISARSRTQLMASQLAMVATLLPSFMLSGFTAPIENMPHALQIVSYAVPARYFVTALKGIFLKGVGLETLWPEALFLAAFAGAVIALTLRAFDKRLG